MNACSTLTGACERDVSCPAEICDLRAAKRERAVWWQLLTLLSVTLSPPHHPAGCSYPRVIPSSGCGWT